MRYLKDFSRSALLRFGASPVLLDVGASGGSFPVWNSISKESIYVGFDPDERDLDLVRGQKFKQKHLIRKAVSASDANEIKFFLTKSPHCSSILEPDVSGLSKYLFSDLFSVEHQVAASATTLASVVNDLNLTSIDWAKFDTQGLDLRLYLSLPDSLRGSVLAVDVEPGIIDAYKGEDKFCDTHNALVQDGFWLESMNVRGSVRMSRESIGEATSMDSKICTEMLEMMPKSPGWVQARYLRSIESLIAGKFSRREFVLLWAFAILVRQFGTAFEVGLAFENRFGRSEDAEWLKRNALIALRQNEPIANKVRRVLPQRVRVALSKIKQFWRS